MRIIIILLFFLRLSSPVFSQEHTDTLLQKTGDSLLAVDSLPGNSKSNLKSKINTIYKKIDIPHTTHKLIKPFNVLKEKVGDTKQRIERSLKSKSRSRDSLKTDELGGIYDQNKRDSISLFEVQQELKISENLSTKEKIAIEYLNTGNSFMSSSKNKEAISYYKKSLSSAPEAHSAAITQQALKSLTEAYTQKADTKMALYYYKQYIDAKDSLSRLQVSQAIADLKSKYEFEKKQREIQSLQLDGEKKKSELQKTLGYIEKQKEIIILIVLALLLTLFLTINLFRQYKAKKQLSETLFIQNNKIEEQKAKLEESLIYTSKLQEALKEDLDHYMQAALRKQMNPHFIFNSLNSIQSFILQNDKLSANIYLSKFAGLMRSVLENSQHRLISLGKEVEVLKLYIELEEQRFDNTFNCTWNIDGNVDLSAHMLPSLILQPYIENAIWHGLLHKEGERLLTINITKNEAHLSCTIEDNGVGRATAMAIRKNKSTRESLGTKITQKRIDLLNSLNDSGIDIQYYDLSDNNGNASGTKVEITIPVTGVFINESE